VSRPRDESYDGSFLERLPLACAWTGCSAPATRLRFLIEGLHPSSLRVCVEHAGVLDWLGGSAPTPLELCDVPPWRSTEHGFAGLEHPTKARYALAEQRELEAAAREWIPGRGYSSSDAAADPAAGELEPAQAGGDGLVGDAELAGDRRERKPVPASLEDPDAEIPLSLFDGVGEL